MTTNNSSNFTNPDLWFRLVYMIVFGLFSWLARIVILVIALLQFLLVLFTGAGNANLRSAGEGIARWTQQTYLFLSFASDEKPYPFQDWPGPVIDLDLGGKSASSAAEPKTVQPVAKTEEAVVAEVKEAEELVVEPTVADQPDAPMAEVDQAEAEIADSDADKSDADKSDSDKPVADKF